jgi:CubicO group peptidase (beta-lactamase class C family)
VTFDQTIDTVLSAAVRDNVIPGAVAAVVDNQGLRTIRSYGVRSEISGDPMTDDTVFQIASMTKPITGVACMQAVERGLLALDQPAGDVIPWLADVQVIDHFDESGPVLRAPQNPVTLRNLLTHTSGFTYEIWNSDVAAWIEHTGAPRTGSGKLASLRQPLSFEPGERWEYGIGIDWAGQLLEAVSGVSLESWMRSEIFEPLRMSDTAYQCNETMTDRLAAKHVLDGEQWKALNPSDRKTLPEFDSGGGGLYSTTLDYARFIQMLLNGGELFGRRLLSSETVSAMSSNNMGQLRVSPVTSHDQILSADFEFMPGVPKSWGLTFQLNEEAVPEGRQMGSMSWAGLFNTHFWVDPKSGLGALLMTQTLPFMIPQVSNLLEQFERATYKAITP